MNQSSLKLNRDPNLFKGPHRTTHELQETSKLPDGSSILGYIGAHRNPGQNPSALNCHCMHMSAPGRLENGLFIVQLEHTDD